MPPFAFARFLPLVFGLACCVSVHGADVAPAPSFKHGVNLSHWLSQNNPSRPYAAAWFDDEDVAWIAANGYDHIRITIDGRLWLMPDGSLDLAAIAPFDRALGWVKQHKLAAILDMHFLPGADFNEGGRDKAVFTDRAVQARAAELWRKVATRYAGEGAYLRFEVLNEPVADENSQVNVFNRSMLSAIRESNPTRIVYLPCNRYSSYKTLVDLEVPADPNVAITFHFYEPFVFTHQRASWGGFPDNMPAVPFPGKVPDLAKFVAPDHFSLKSSGTELTVAADIDAPFAAVAEWAKAKAPGREIYLGEFGVFRTADTKSLENWIHAVRAACARHDFGWCVWDYQGGFAVRDPKGKPTAVHQALMK